MTVLKQKGFTQRSEARGGFTLIELLIVIAILGTLAVVVLLALNPVQQLARTRDSGRTSAVTQIGHAVEAYATSNAGVYPGGTGACALGAATFIDCLVTASEIQTNPAAITYSAGAATACTGGTDQDANLCYDYDGTTNSFIVYATSEADSNISRCPTGQNGYFVYSSDAGRGGLWCGNAEPATPLAGDDAGWLAI
ncbi:hypothetical protein A2801_02835 [Candidatus Woesebacteria bacterium RIFCSPHIGHO2_01_FULL_41_10]|uniref:Type II secretion system protein GspG C-terminal domain-containing protein n=1 Tax=Candidatus Woesebacteria bacterium RIFCSPHIGHO2_01_FULL_41_10 TaxID=1802500 RepID=A0A1F7YNI9_9BACT|nr:MAG: hypothetical protein A2801_02835 [Candidatus Woesebacteria bacterium RIFCSPHIGHO2_01_FULL_41_10]